MLIVRLYRRHCIYVRIIIKDIIIINVPLFILSELHFKQILFLFALLFPLNEQYNCVYINFQMSTASDVRALKEMSLTSSAMCPMPMESVTIWSVSRSFDPSSLQIQLGH